MDGLPDDLDDGGFELWRATPELWAPVVREIARRADIHVTTLSPFRTGTNLVVDLNGSAVLKLFPPIYAAMFASERATLRQLDGHLSIPIPRILAEGQESGWSWLIMTKLAGTVGSEVWPALPEDDRLHILHAIGRTIAEVQTIPPGDLAVMEPVWPVFIARQTEQCIARHRSQGLADHLLKDLPDLLANAPNVLPELVNPVILTGEWIPENLLLAQTAEGWRLAAVFDFGDVLTGPGEYDLLGPSAFMCAGMPDRVRSLLEGYRITPGQYDAAMRRRLFTLQILHGASDLRNIAIPGWEEAVGGLDDLQNLIWPEVFQSLSGFD